MTYIVKPIIKKGKNIGWGVYRGDELVNDWIHEKKEDAEKKAELLRAWYATDNTTE